MPHASSVIRYLNSAPLSCYSVWEEWVLIKSGSVLSSVTKLNMKFIDGFDWGYQKRWQQDFVVFIVTDWNSIYTVCACSLESTVCKWYFSRFLRRLPIPYMFSMNIWHFSKWQMRLQENSSIKSITMTLPYHHYVNVVIAFQSDRDEVQYFSKPGGTLLVWLTQCDALPCLVKPCFVSFDLKQTTPIHAYDLWQQWL